MSATAELTNTRTTLHRIAEHLLTAHQWRVARTIRLSVGPDGFRTQQLGASPSVLAVRGTDLIRGPDERTLPISGTLGELAELAGVRLGLSDLPYPVSTTGDPDTVLQVHEAAAIELIDAWWQGQNALVGLLQQLDADAAPPVLWPEHFDLGVSVAEVNYGVSAGDEQLPVPYAYVGPWQPRSGDFWTHSFGAARSVAQLGDQQAMLEFFLEGTRRAGQDPVRS